MNPAEVKRAASEQRTVDVEVEGVRAEGRTLRGYAAVFGVLSEDLGGFRERIAPGAFAEVLSDDVRLLVDHDPPPLARTKAGTLRLREDDRGLYFEADLPDTTKARDLRESVARGDVDGASFRFVIGEESWAGDVRTIVKVAELRDVTVATYPAYPAASIELRSSAPIPTGGERRQKGASMDPQDNGAETAETETTTTATASEADGRAEQAEAETRSAPEPSPAGSLQVEDRASAPMRGLADEFRAAGFPGEAAEIPWERYEERAVTWSPSVNLLHQVDRQGGPFPFDARYAWTALDREPVDSAATSVLVLVQTAQDAATGIVRDIDSTSDKAEVGSTVDLVTVPLKNVAGVQTGIKNIVLEQPPIRSIIERDLRAAVNDGLDDLVVASFAASGHQAPGTDNLLVSIRKAITTLVGNGYAPDTVLLTPAASEQIDVMTTGVLGADAAAAPADFVFGAGVVGPERIFGCRRLTSKGVASVTVLDSRAYGKLYASPVRLDRFEENAGRTNTATARLELSAAMGVERQSAAVRIAAS